MSGTGGVPTRSWWLDHLDSGDPAAVGALPSHADVVVIGAGFTGCAVAYHLGLAGAGTVVVLDSRGLGAGATGRNGGQLWANLSSKFEVETAREVLAFIEQHHVDCDLQRGGAVSLSPMGVRPATPLAAGAESGGVQHWDAARCHAELGSRSPMSFAGGLYNPDAAQFFPAKVCAALLDATPTAALHALVKATGLGGSAGQHTVATTAGTIIAGTVVVATNGWTPALLPELEGILYPVRNHVMMTAPVAHKWRVGAFSVGSGTPDAEIYAICRADRRICIGGMRSQEPNSAVGSLDDTTLAPSVGAALRKFLAETFEEVITIEQEWTGVLGFTHDDLPLIGQLPTRPDGVYIAAGYSGHGMPQCYGAGKAISQMIAGRGHPGDLDQYIQACDPARFPSLNAASSHL